MRPHRSLAALAALVLGLGTTVLASPVGINPFGDAEGDYIAVSGTGTARAGTSCDYDAPLPAQPPCTPLLAVSATGAAHGGLVSVGGADVLAAAGGCAADPSTCTPATPDAGALVDAGQAIGNGLVDGGQRLARRNGDLAQSLADGAADSAQRNADVFVDFGQSTAENVTRDPAGYTGRAVAGARGFAEDVGEHGRAIVDGFVEAAPGHVETLGAFAQRTAAELQSRVLGTAESAPGTARAAIDAAVAEAEETVREVPDECVQVEADAACSDVAVSATGDSSASTLAVSGTGSASACQPSLLCVAASGTGPAQGYFAASGAGAAQACEPGTDYLCTAASVAGPAQGDDYAVSVLGDANGGDVGVSGTGHASGTIAISGCDAASALCISG